MHNQENFSIYRPTPVILPKNLGIKRNQRPYSFATEPEKALPPEFYTVLFDIFRAPDSSCLMAIGPGLRSLAKHLLPLKFVHKNKTLKHKLRTLSDYKRAFSSEIILIKIELERSLLESDEPIELKCVTPLFEQTVSIPPNPFRHDDFRLTLMTVQQNNPGKYIVDWADYYTKVHGIDRLIIYDNGSSNFDDLVDALRGLSDRLRVVCIPWNYPYGLPGNAFCQRGALNHVFRMAGTSNYYLNFDIDEYLVNRTEADLFEYLNKHIKGRTSALALKEYRVPRVSRSGENLNNGMEISKFIYREKASNKKFSKTILSPRRTLYSTPHHTIPDRLGLLLYPLKSYRVKQFLRSHPKLSFIFRYEKWPPGDELHFNHYDGLNTGWRGQGKEKNTKFDAAVHERDETMINTLRKHF